MFFNPESQGTIKNVLIDDSLSNWIDAFIIDRKSLGITSGTLHFYKTKFKLFKDYCDDNSINSAAVGTAQNCTNIMCVLN